ncbi:MAG: aminopeptidase P family protein [Rhodothermales bacterium]|nr:aminopeptidase P family protein [Rhodothermales bacterium]
MTNQQAAVRSRQERLEKALDQYGFSAVAINAGPTLTYLTGLHFHLSERPVVAVFAPGKPVCLALPELEMTKASQPGFDLSPFAYGENPAQWHKAFDDAFEAAGAVSGRIGVEPRALRVLELRFIEGAASGVSLESAEECVASLRIQKDTAELDMMKEAVGMAEASVQATVKAVGPGATEKEIASELVIQLLRNGSGSALPFDPIVAAGPNSANPHAVPTDRKLQAGEILLIDWGANNGGYFSDLTRVFSYGEPSKESIDIARITAEANAAGRAAAGPGVTAGSVDRATRAVIEKSGYGEYFTHRTGHGLGMEVHEEPYIRGDNEQILEPGMTFTIEPGIYLVDKAGTRVEDDMVITETGADSLSSIERGLVIL